MRLSHRFPPLVALIIGILVCSVTAQAVSLVQPGVQTIGVGYDPCPSHADHVCWVRLHPEPARLMPAGGSAWFTPVFDAAAPDWTRQSGTLNGTYRISIYNAFNDCPLGGAEFEIRYTPGSGDPTTLRWTQGIFTNHRLGGRHGTTASYMDIKNPATGTQWPSPYYPYQYTNSMFYDKPSRYCPSTGLTYWIGECYATTTTPPKTMKIYEGVEWGFIYTCIGKSRSTTVRTGGSDAVVDYDATTQAMSVSAPVDIVSVTGMNAVDPEFTADPLNNGLITASGMTLALEQEDMLLFTGGDLTITGQDGIVLLRADIEAVHVDDGMYPQYGYNMIFVFGDIEEYMPTPGTFMTDFYFPTLDMADQYAPFMTMTTVEPLSQRILAGLGSSTSATLVDSFQIIEPHSHYGDGNGDRYVNLDDWTLFNDCMTGPGTISGEQCFWADSDGDRDVDLDDFAAFQERFGTVPEQQDVGACCQPDGTCEQTTGFECLEIIGGDYRGPGTNCSDLDPACDGPMPGMVVINEIWADDPGADDHEFIELFGPPMLPLDGLSLIVVDGDTLGNEDSVNYRKVNFRADLSDYALNEEGFFLMGTGPNLSSIVDVNLDAVFGNDNGVADEIQNGSQTYALVMTSMIEYCMGVGIPDPYCSGETTQLTQNSVFMISLEGAIDLVSTRDVLIDDSYFFAPVVLDAEFGEFDAAYRVPNGMDMNSTGDWWVSEACELGDSACTATPGTWNSEMGK